VEPDTERREVVEPVDVAQALDEYPLARAAYERLSYSRKREQVLAIASAKKPATRSTRIEKAVAALIERASAADGATSPTRRTKHQPLRGGR